MVNGYLVHLKICAIQWKATSHGRSAWYLLLAMLELIDKLCIQLEKSGLGILHIFFLRIYFRAIYEYSYQKSSPNSLRICFSNAVAWWTCLIGTQLLQPLELAPPSRWFNWIHSFTWGRTLVYLIILFNKCRIMSYVNMQ